MYPKSRMYMCVIPSRSLHNTQNQAGADEGPLPLGLEFVDQRITKALAKQKVRGVAASEQMLSFIRPSDDGTCSIPQILLDFTTIEVSDNTRDFVERVKQVRLRRVSKHGVCIRASRKLPQPYIEP